MNRPPDLEKLCIADYRHRVAASRGSYQVQTAAGHRIPLDNILQGRSAFLLLNGPSVSALELSPLTQRGVVTMGVNNGPAIFKPNYWVCVDGPERFIEQIWKDATITKFAPLSQMGKRPRVRGANGELRDSAYPIERMPNVNFFARSQQFNPSEFLLEPSFNWGCWEGQRDSLGQSGKRSVMLVALKLLFWLGAKNVYLLGTDFRMEPGQKNYSFEQGRTDAAIKNNNALYEVLNQRFTALQPYFIASGFKVWNCTENSGLTAFPVRSFSDAITEAARECNEKPIVTAGMYEPIKK